jgi:glycosyltransferase involved in cell wall biosynthesis
MTMKLFIATGIFHPEPGGPATYLRELLPELLARGWQIRGLTFSEPAHMDAPSPGFPLTRIARAPLPLRYARYWRASRAGLAWADVTYLHSLGLPLAPSRRAPRVVKIVGDAAWERAVRKGWIADTTDIDRFQTERSASLQAELGKRLRAREAASLDGVIVPSAYLKRMVMGWGVAPERVRVIYNALPPETRRVAGTQHDARAQLRLDDAPTVLTVGRILPWKGVDHLIRALRSVADVRLIVAGDGDSLPQLQTLAESLGVADRVRLLGRVPRDEVALWMRAADYVALYSGYEGLSHTLLESLRVGTPCIASDKGGNPEVVQHGVNGWLVPYFADNPAAAADALAESLRSAFAPGIRERLAAQAGVGMERFDFQRMIDATALALEAVAAGR